MKINCIKKINSNLENDEFRVLIEYNSNNYFITNFENYITKYDSIMNMVIVKDKYNNYVHINKEDIVYFSSDKKINYCKTMDDQYVINKKLYEIEKLDKEYLRISKNCIVNIRQIECFDMSKTRKNYN